MIIVLLIVVLEARHIHRVAGTVKGQLVTPFGYPFGTQQPIDIDLAGSKQSLVTDVLGQFSFSMALNGQEVSGSLTADVLQQFTVTIALEGKVVANQVDLGKLVVNNHKEQLVSIAGSVVAQDTKVPITSAVVTLNFSKPLMLDVVNVTTTPKGTFDATINLMQLLVYGVDLRITAEGYEDWDCMNNLPSECTPGNGLALYNTFTYQFSAISLVPALITCKVDVKVASKSTKLPLPNVQLSVLCQSGSYAQAFQPINTNQFGLAVFQATLDRQDMYFCNIWTYTNPISSETFTLSAPSYAWDGTTNENMYIWV